MNKAKNEEMSFNFSHQGLQHTFSNGEGEMPVQRGKEKVFVTCWPARSKIVTDSVAGSEDDNSGKFTSDELKGNPPPSQLTADSNISSGCFTSPK